MVYIGAKHRFLKIKILKHLLVAAKRKPPVKQTIKTKIKKQKQIKMNKQIDESILFDPGFGSFI
jgi:hypothetical protein